MVGRREILSTLAWGGVSSKALAIGKDEDFGKEDNWLTRMDRSSSEGRNGGVAPPEAVYDKSDGSVKAMVQNPFGGPPSSVSFVSPWKPKKSSVLNFGSAEKNQDAFVAVARATADVDKMSQAELLDSFLGRDSRFGTYGAPTNIKVRSDATDGGLRTLDVSFTAQGAQLEVDKRVIAGARVSESGALVLLVAGSSKAKWAESEADARGMVASFKAK